MKNITRSPLLSGAPVVFEDLKQSISDLVDGLNDVKYRQLPENCVDEDNLTLAEEITFEDEWVYQDTTRGPYNTIIGTKQFPPLFPAGAPEGLLSPSDSSNPGWNDLFNITGLNEGYRAYLISKPGIAVGHACIDSELRCSVADGYEDYNTHYTNGDLWVQYAVTANNQIIATSPRLFAGRHSITIPFATFTGAETIEFAIKFRVYFGQIKFLESTEHNREPLAVYQTDLFIRQTSV
jgi:hypothetical protein